MKKSIIVEVKRPATVDRVEIELPLFSKFGNKYYCITSANEGVQINAYPSINCYTLSSITEREFGEALDWDVETITKQEFEKVLDKAFMNINKILNQ
jgi:hypothetical protein